MPVNPLRLAAALLLAACVAYGSYQMVKPETFSYIKLRDGVMKEGGMLLTLDDLEEEVLTLGAWSDNGKPPIDGLLPWSETAAYVGQPLARRVTGGLPLLKTDLEIHGESTLEPKLGASVTAMSIPVDNVLGVTPHIAVGERVHLYASFEDEAGAHSGLLLRDMPVIAVQREQESEVPSLVAVTISLNLDEAVLLTHALHYGKIRLGKAGLTDGTKNGVGDAAFAAALMKTRKRWSDEEEVQ
ncbi:RcpC/CpaB family pilus assembly protein [Brevibacillus sp. H7]|uniref:RcpC/CpaB family pilus assembly protein n=1 Tax=Brevibacillus sp. H7 TaxID=3349138 RepID=UPI003813EDDD